MVHVQQYRSRTRTLHYGNRLTYIFHSTETNVCYNRHDTYITKQADL